MNTFKCMLVLLFTVVGLSGCGSDCTEQELKEKLAKLSLEIQGLAAKGDMSKLMEFSKKAKDISQSTQNDNNLQAACEAIDELMDEL